MNPAATVVALEPALLLATALQETRFGCSPALRPDPGRPDPGRPDPGRPDPGQPDPGRCQEVGLALMSAQAGAAMRLISMTLEMGDGRLAAGEPLVEAFVRVDRRSRSLAFLSVEARRDGRLIFRGQALFRASGP